METLISALLLVVVAGAIFTAIDVAARSGADDRNRTRANAIASEDQARLTAMKVSQLGNLRETREVVRDDVTYTVVSTGNYVSDSSGTTDCSGESTASYVAIESSVSWGSLRGRPPVRLETLITPPGGPITPDKGALAVSTTDGESAPIEGVTITGNGPTTFSGITNANGCVIFANLPEGNYTMSAAALAGYVDNDGNLPIDRNTSVTGLGTNVVALQLARPGQINVSYRTRPRGTNTQPASTNFDTATVFNVGMTAPKSFGTAGTMTSTLAAGPLFPFDSPINVYGGGCTAHNPAGKSGVPATATANVIVPQGGSVGATVDLPALYLDVRNGTPSNPGTLRAGATVHVTDITSGCEPVKRSYVSNASGRVDIGLAYGTYFICSRVSSSLRDAIASRTVMNYSSGTSATLYLGRQASGSSTCA